MRLCLACSASWHDRAQVLLIQLQLVSVYGWLAQLIYLVSVRLLPESLRAPVLALPPREPVLALPPREGRALSRLVGVFGAIVSRLHLKYVDGGGPPARTGGVCRWVRVLPRRVERTKSRNSCEARLCEEYSCAASCVCRRRQSFKNMGATAKGGCNSACGSTPLFLV
jgi:hypothetical protein